MSENTIKVDINHGEVNPRNLDIRIGSELFDHSNTPLIDDGIGLVTRDYGLHEENGIVIFLDALGMRGIWRRLDINPHTRLKSMAYVGHPTG